MLAGAVGAHVWRDELLVRNSLANFQLATEYLFYHALGIAVVALLVDRFPAQKLQSVGWCMAAGTAVFSGSLLVSSLTGFQSITAITPMGGILLIAGPPCRPETGQGAGKTKMTGTIDDMLSRSGILTGTNGVRSRSSR